MGFFSTLFGRQRESLTASWEADPAVLLEFDAQRHTLNGVRLGDPVERLRGLGPVEDWRALRVGDLVYASRGLRLGVSEGLLDSFSLIWSSPYEPGFRSFPGHTLLNGREIGLSSSCTEPELRAWFGEPYWRDADEDEVLLFYEWADCEWQVELAPDGKLRSLLVVREPMLADAQARDSYGVTRPWPPPR
ncbi:MAG: hypothetical protein ACOX6T_01260 [Myxococcales bacterium]|jgi:hypothetical protein